MEPSQFTIPDGVKVQINARRFSGKTEETATVLEGLSAGEQAGLRQFSLERMTGYGVEYADAIELRSRIISGESWREAAQTLAQHALDAAERTAPPASARSKALLYHRASALLRMSQALMLEDNDERRAIVKRAVECYALAAGQGIPREHVHIPGELGTMSGWFVAAASESAGAVIVIGGVEGWAMDFDTIGDAMAQRGLDTLLLDAPGQGETRILNRHYLSSEWMTSFRRAIDFVEQRCPGKPIGIVGNSMGGAIAITMANNDLRIRACINNGGIMKPSMARMAGPTFFTKMIAFCGIEGQDLEERAAAIWDHVEPLKAGSNQDYPLLVMQGGHDLLVSDEHSKIFMAETPTSDKAIEYFSDGIHCIYNHLQDRDIVMADWMLAQLGTAHKP